ncbi:MULTISPECIES: GreA/GreB family elongation factor [unclassified Spirosoma]|uniref:GreA/GreB family elongation factor n=1 Tax=unclassified Spirosoma TaxID=2621999 RepID=UPI0009687389|nr:MULTISPECIES: GreA/GreB family elongation factor [unclassified Spirosoma]MBN8820682.1 GreA/GreB family elongation factor [Spirosoma sp.]OJW77831.1 MAG: hypothetical protein BGO59_04490 [Spirosoma sp. 48-14]
MTNRIISLLDYQRLKLRIGQIKPDSQVSSSQLITLVRGVNSATLLDPTNIPANVVTMHTRVKLSYPDSQKTVSLQIVYPEEADSTQSKVSVLAPIATALLGRKVNDLVCLLTPYGTVRVKIDYILYQPEAAGDFSL